MIRKRQSLLVLFLVAPAMAWGHPSFHLNFHPHIRPHLHLRHRATLMVSVDGHTEQVKSPILPLEVSVRIKDLTPVEEALIQDCVRARLGSDAEVVPAWSCVAASAPEPGEVSEPITLLQVEFHGRRSRYDGAGPIRTCLINMGRGAAVGSAVGAFVLCESEGLTAPAALQILGSSATVGGLVGLAIGPRSYRDHCARMASLGYLPWDFGLRWRIVERRPGKADKVLDKGSEELAQVSFLNPLAQDAGDVLQVRQENLRAGLEALLATLTKRRDDLVAGCLPQG
jgi:hypothetical protein